MLLWEALKARAKAEGREASTGETVAEVVGRLPFDRRCAALTKNGKRCRGKIREGREWCVFHDPEVAAKRKPAPTPENVRRHRRLAHLPDGYLRKLTNHRAVGNALDRIYREIRLGIVTPEMGRVLFGILTRLMDTGLLEDAARIKVVQRTKAGRMRPKVEELLTRTERGAWRDAITNVPANVLEGKPHSPPLTPSTDPLPAPIKMPTDRSGDRSTDRAIDRAEDRILKLPKQAVS